jgi:hypothetical protein
MRRSTMRWAPMLVMLLGGCDSLLDLRVQTEVLCVPVAKQSFSPSMVPPGLPLAGTTSKTVMIDFSKPLAQLPGKEAGIKLDVRLDQVFIRTTEPGDLGFVKRLKASLAPGNPAVDLPTVPLGEYLRPSPRMPTREVKIQSSHDANVFAYLDKEPARLLFTATGSLPTEPFTADVEACVFVQSQAKY